MPQQVLNYVDLEAVELRLADPSISPELVEEYYRFGQVLFSEMLSRGADVERKLTNMLGWSTASLGFLLVYKSEEILTRVIAGGAIGSAALAAIICAMALRSKMWATPSEQDWFQEELTDAATLKRYHVVSFLLAHQCQTRHMAKKADQLRQVEGLLGLTSLAVALLAAARLFW
jgi:hypothetical protein